MGQSPQQKKLLICRDDLAPDFLRIHQGGQTNQNDPCNGNARVGVAPPTGWALGSFLLVPECFSLESTRQLLVGLPAEPTGESDGYGGLFLGAMSRSFLFNFT